MQRIQEFRTKILARGQFDQVITALIGEATITAREVQRDTVRHILKTHMNFILLTAVVGNRYGLRYFSSRNGQ